jgi:nucleotide-binding universal stress UspA family protein
MKNFIVPVDFSTDSLKGLDMAILFAKKQTTNIQLVYVQKSSSDYRPGTLEEEHRYAEMEFKKILDKYEKELKFDSKIKFIIKKGKIYEEIVEQAESYKESVISASTHGASGFEEFFIGSNAFKIITASSNPVFTLRKKAPKQIKKIVVPLKMHVDTRQKVPVAAEIAEIFGAEIHLITINNSKSQKTTARLNAYLAQSSDYLNRRQIDFVTKKLNGDSLVAQVNNYVSAVDADLVTIMTGEGGTWSALLGMYAQQMLYRSNIPVLSVTAREKHVPAGFATQGRYK